MFAGNISGKRVIEIKAIKSVKNFALLVPLLKPENNFFGGRFVGHFKTSACLNLR